MYYLKISLGTVSDLGGGIKERQRELSKSSFSDLIRVERYRERQEGWNGNGRVIQELKGTMLCDKLDGSEEWLYWFLHF